jgi:hypothetical protein
MKSIKAKKSGRWAQEDPAKKQVIMIEGNTYGENSVPVPMMDMRVDKDFAEFVKVKETKSLENEDDGPKTGIDEIIAGVFAGETNKNKKKVLLEKWAIDALNIDIDRGKSLDFLIEYVTEEYVKAHG